MGQLGRFLLRGLRILRSQQLRRSSSRQSVEALAGDSKGLLHDRGARQGRPHRASERWFHLLCCPSVSPVASFVVVPAKGLLAGHAVRLGGDVPLAIKEENPRQLSSFIQLMHRDDADRAVTPWSWASGLQREVKKGGGHGCAGARPCRCALEKTAPGKGRASASRQPLRGVQAGAGRVACSPAPGPAFQEARR